MQGEKGHFTTTIVCVGLNTTRDRKFILVTLIHSNGPETTSGVKYFFQIRKGRLREYMLQLGV